MTGVNLEFIVETFLEIIHLGTVLLEVVVLVFLDLKINLIKVLKLKIITYLFV